MKVDGKELAESIDLFCEMKNIQKNDFFSATSTSSGSLSQWRTGLHNPSARVVRAIEQFVGMPIEQFLSKYKKTPTAQGDGLSDEIMAFAREFQAASPDVRQAVLTILRASAKQPPANQAGRSE